METDFQKWEKLAQERMALAKAGWNDANYANAKAAALEKAKATGRDMPTLG